MAPAMPCRIMKNCGSDGSNKIKTKLACILEADESTRMRMGNSIPHYHQDHTAGKGENSSQYYNLVHKFIPKPQAMKIPAAKAAVDKEWEKLEKISAWNLTKVKSKKEVIDEARMSGATVHFASLVDICHLKNAELEAKHQKYKGRVVLRGDIVKGHSGSYAVFTEQGSSASQMTAAKIMDIISRLPGCDGQDPSKNGRCSQIIENSKIGVSRHLDSSTTTCRGNRPCTSYSRTNNYVQMATTLRTTLRAQCDEQQEHRRAHGRAQHAVLSTLRAAH